MSYRSPILSGPSSPPESSASTSFSRRDSGSSRMDSRYEGLSIKEVEQLREHEDRLRRRGSEPSLSYIAVVSGDKSGIYQYVSDSVTDVLGFEPAELLGRSCYKVFHPEELAKLGEVHYRALADESAACVAYMRLLHKDGYWVECSVSYSTVYDKSLTLVSRIHAGSRGFEHAITAREIFEISPASQGRFSITRQGSAASSPSPPKTASPTPPPFHQLPPSSRTPRTFFLIDRFTNTARVMYVSNDVIVNGNTLKNNPFYSIIKPSDRALVRDHIERAKQSSPLGRDYRGSGGHAYTRFSVLKIPDLPPISSIWPGGTDESERMMPGQEFIQVEAIFTASSDGLTCVIERLQSE